MTLDHTYTVGDFVGYTDDYADPFVLYEPRLALGRVESIDVTNDEVIVSFPMGNPYTGTPTDTGLQETFKLMLRADEATEALQLSLLTIDLAVDAVELLTDQRDEALDVAAVLGEVIVAQEEAMADANADVWETDSFNESLFAVAIEYDRQATFSYAKGDGYVIETRRLQPERIYTDNAGDKIVAGYDPDREEPRSYRVGRVKGDVRLGSF